MRLSVPLSGQKRGQAILRLQRSFRTDPALSCLEFGSSIYEAEQFPAGTGISPTSKARSFKATSVISALSPSSWHVLAYLQWGVDGGGGQMPAIE